MAQLPPLSNITAVRPLRLPLSSLLALAATCFIIILTETLPAGLLLPMSAGLQISTGMTGQLVTAYAAGSLIAAIPLSIATRNWERRFLLISALAVFTIVNFLTAITSQYKLILILRFLVGMSAGLLWSIVAGYAARIVTPEYQGRAIAIAMAGTPIALSLGLPASAVLGQLLGWRIVFELMSLFSLLLTLWIRWKMPKLSGNDEKTRLALWRVFALPGMPAILLTLLVFILAHNMLYTYIGALVIPAGVNNHLGDLLLVFGMTSLLSIAFIGSQVDKHLRKLMLGSCVLFLLATACFALWINHITLIYIAVGIWGLGYGGAATLFQAATARTAGAEIDIAQSMTVVVWNLAIGGGGVLGGLLLSSGPVALPFTALPLLFIALITVGLASKNGFR